jgi:DNA repair exonuclease SbcCD ATPase subunit
MITFEKVRWRNFLSTGNTFSEIDLQSAKTNLIVGANGAGKSTVLDALTFGLFGKSFRKINKPSLVNSINEKDCLVEVEFSIGSKQYLIRRGIKPNLFEINVDGQLWNQESTVVDQQKNFEQNVLKMNYKSFTQVVILGSSTFVPFMRLPLAQRRDIIEDILDIQIFSVMNDNLRDKVKENNEELKQLESTLSLHTKKIDLQKEYMLDLEKKAKSDIEKKESKISSLKVSQSGAMQQVDELNVEVADLNDQLKTLSDARKKLKKMNTFKAKIQQKIDQAKKYSQFFIDNDICPTCTQEITQDLKDKKIKDTDDEWEKLNAGLEDLQKTIDAEEKREEKFVELSDQVVTVNSSINQINYEINSLGKSIKELQDEIKDLSSGSTDNRVEFEKLKQLVDQKKTFTTEISYLKKDKDVLITATQLLKDSGIKTRIIKTYLPTMNKLINQYLQSMDFYVNFTLDENFEETIKSRHRDIFSYESFSEGEKARIDIALLLTWRSIAKLKNSVDTNLLILDEIFDGSLDQSGSSDLGWILRNFDDNTNVFVISHKESMNDKFDRTLLIEKPKNFSTINES